MQYKKKYFRAGLIIVIVGILGIGSFFLIKKHFKSQKISSADQDIIKKVSELTEVPQGESPVVKKVENLSSEEKQSLTVFKDVENGDYMVVFPQAKKVIFYDPDKQVILRQDSVVNQK